MNTVKLSCDIDTTDADCPLGIEIWIDNEQIFDCVHVTETINFVGDFNDDNGEHTLKFVMKGKQPSIHRSMTVARLLKIPD